jgi:hypothetical protein
MADAYVTQLRALLHVSIAREHCTEALHGSVRAITLTAIPHFSAAFFQADAHHYL